jgi:hypothetical protein
MDLPFSGLKGERGECNFCTQRVQMLSKSLNNGNLSPGLPNAIFAGKRQKPHEIVRGLVKYNTLNGKHLD